MTFKIFVTSLMVRRGHGGRPSSVKFSLIFQNEKDVTSNEPRTKSPSVNPRVEETVANRFQEISLKSPRLGGSRFGSRDELDSCIVPRRTPRPPARRRPKSTPITHPLNSQLTQLMAEKKR